MFEKNSYVFHESGGICRISDICYAPLDGMPTDRLYYVMKPFYDPSGTIYVPVDSDRIFLRGLMKETEARSLLETLDTVEILEEPCAKLLRGRYVESMRTYAPTEWVRVIKTVSARTQACKTRTQRLSETERGYAETAWRNLCTELSLVLHIDFSEAEGLLPEAWSF